MLVLLSVMLQYCSAVMQWHAAAVSFTLYMPLTTCVPSLG